MGYQLNVFRPVYVHTLTKAGSIFQSMSLCVHILHVYDWGCPCIHKYAVYLHGDCYVDTILIIILIVNSGLLCTSFLIMYWTVKMNLKL